MIYGIGTDICDIRRIQASLEQHGERFAAKILTPTELAAWQERRSRSPERGVRFVATRFCAKEALSKAIGLGMVLPMSWQACQITTLDSGQPALLTHGALHDWLQERQLSIHLSISDEQDYAVGFCVVEKPPSSPIHPPSCA